MTGVMTGTKSVVSTWSVTLSETTSSPRALAAARPSARWLSGSDSLAEMNAMVSTPLFFFRYL